MVLTLINKNFQGPTFIGDGAEVSQAGRKQRQERQEGGEEQHGRTPPERRSADQHDLQPGSVIQYGSKYFRISRLNFNQTKMPIFYEV